MCSTIVGVASSGGKVPCEDLLAYAVVYDSVHNKIVGVKSDLLREFVHQHYIGRYVVSSKHREEEVCDR